MEALRVRHRIRDTFPHSPLHASDFIRLERFQILWFSKSKRPSRIRGGLFVCVSASADSDSSPQCTTREPSGLDYLRILAGYRSDTTHQGTELPLAALWQRNDTMRTPRSERAGSAPQELQLSDSFYRSRIPRHSEEIVAGDGNSSRAVGNVPARPGAIATDSLVAALYAVCLCILVHHEGLLR